ncbi:MAG: hypothetical protein QXG39_00910 [Candidatus Aenigmatarchaeota archaeon]
MKGVIEIALVAVAILILLEGFFLNVFIGKQITLKQTAKELEIIKAVNKMESVKRGLPYSLYYSFEEALKRSGYSSFSQVQDLEGFEKNISIIFNEYMEELEEKAGVKISMGKIKIIPNGNELVLQFSSPSSMKYEYSSNDFSFTILDNPNVTIILRNGFFVENI